MRVKKLSAAAKKKRAQKKNKSQFGIDFLHLNRPFSSNFDFCNSAQLLYYIIMSPSPIQAHQLVSSFIQNHQFNPVHIRILFPFSNCCIPMAFLYSCLCNNQIKGGIKIIFFLYQQMQFLLKTLPTMTTTSTKTLPMKALPMKALPMMYTIPKKTPPMN